MKLTLTRYIGLREIVSLVNELEVGDTLSTAETTTAGNFFRTMMFHIRAPKQFNLTVNEIGVAIIERSA